MDPNPNKFPILSYFMSRVPQFGPKPVTDSEWHQIDLEQPPAPPPPDQSTSTSTSTQNLPNINHPEVLKAVTEIHQTRSILQTLGDRPDHETIDTARARIADIDTKLWEKLEQITLDPRPEDVDPVKWRAKIEEKETECRKEAEKEREMCKAVVRIDEMHESYEKMLKEAEDRLVSIYGTVASAAERSAVEEEVNEEIVKILQHPEGLDKVELVGRQLRILPEAFGKLRGLVSLNLSTNQLETIPDSIAGLEILEELNLSSNLLESLPDSIGLLLNLKILNVSANKLKALPDSISHCRSLVELDASFNALSYLPTNIGYELVNLKRLSVHLNKIRSLPTSVCEMSSLRILDAHFNELRVLPNAIGRLTNLETLNLSSNFSDLKELPDTIGDLTNLRELDLSNNQIHALPYTFYRLDSLINLNLEHNPIVFPPMEIVNEGAGAVKEFLAKRWLEILEQEQRSSPSANSQAPTGWLTRSTSALSSWASVVSGSVTGYLGAGEKSPSDPYLDQQL